MSVFKRAPKRQRRRFSYSETDQRRWLSVGALLVASAATLGYLWGRFSEQYKTHRGKNRIVITQNDAMPEMIEFQRDYRILIFGDSTTWGYDPDTQTRLKRDERYTHILEKRLNSNSNMNESGGSKYRLEIISEGLNGRTINHEDKDGNKKNERRELSMKGIAQILPLLYSHKPLDIIILMLGINDCKARFNGTANRIAHEMRHLIEKCIKAEIWQQEQDASIILISPPSIRELTAHNKEWGFTKQSIEISRNIYTQYVKVIGGKFDSVVLLNANHIIQTGSDSVHLDAANNIKLADALYPIIIHKLKSANCKMNAPSFLTSASVAVAINIEQDNESDSLSELEQQRNEMK